jgi:hypothetical protein
MVHAEISAYDAADDVMRLVTLATGAIPYDYALGKDDAGGWNCFVLHAGGVQQPHRFRLEL